MDPYKDRRLFLVMMTRMTAVLVFSAFCVAGAFSSLTDLHVKFALWDGFYDIPLTENEIKLQIPPKYVLMAHDNELNVNLYSYPNDPRFSILIDTFGNIAGIRTAYIKEDVGKRAKSNNIPFQYTYDDKPMFTNGSYYNTPLWYTSVLFVNPDKLKAGGRATTGGLVAEDVYVKLDGKWTAVSKDECQVEAQGFTKQACFTGMGMHYFYKMSPNVTCNDLQGVFVLYECGQLIGLGLTPFGSFSKKDRMWFEDPPASVVESIVTNRPPCLGDWVTNFGTTSLHIFFKRFPRLTFCSWPWQINDRCGKQ